MDNYEPVDSEKQKCQTDRLVARQGGSSKAGRAGSVLPFAVSVQLPIRRDAAASLLGPEQRLSPGRGRHVATEPDANVLTIGIRLPELDGICGEDVGGPGR